MELGKIFPLYNKLSETEWQVHVKKSVFYVKFIIWWCFCRRDFCLNKIFWRQCFCLNKVFWWRCVCPRCFDAIPFLDHVENTVTNMNKFSRRCQKRTSFIYSNTEKRYLMMAPIFYFIKNLKKKHKVKDMFSKKLRRNNSITWNIMC